MIDLTNGKILRHMTALGRENRRRYAFQRMLQATDRVLWRLEELNRDGVKTVPKRVRKEVLELGESMPSQIAGALRDSGQVQDTLDSLFDVQERLFRWRYPDWHDFDPEGEGLDVVAS